MASINADEVSMPTLVYSDVFYNENREKLFKNEVFSFNDRNNKRMNLCPSSEELFAYLASQKVKSYKDLHFTLFQMGSKYRDEEHPELGLVRKKEFLIADACSFDADEGGLDVSYDKMFMVFKHIFNKIPLDTIVVEADPYEVNGISSEEFQVLSEDGDKEIVKCTSCTYACNIEDASSKSVITNREISNKEKKLVSTPNVKSIKEVSDYLNVFESNILKSLICKVDGSYKMILLKGESELNIKKLKLLFKTNNIEIPSVNELEKIGTSVGYVGPIGCTMEIIADNEVKSMHNFVCGSNKKDYHYINVNYGKDFRINRFADLKLFDKHSLCPKCKNKCEIVRGIEVGQINKLGDNYSSLYDLYYTDEVNKECKVHMGSYQIGIDRIISAIVEHDHDDNGIIWPMNVAPYKVAIVISNVNDNEIKKYSNSLYDKLMSEGIDTILDDRKESIGVKFNDMDLIGIPIRVTVGNLLKDNLVEVKLRNEKDSANVALSEIVDYIKETIYKTNSR